jgi:ABC-type sugar transport system substrate-binding protein
MGRVAVEAAVKAIKGEPIDAETSVRIGLVTKETGSE